MDKETQYFKGFWDPIKFLLIRSCSTTKGSKSISVVNTVAVYHPFKKLAEFL